MREDGNDADATGPTDGLRGGGEMWPRPVRHGERIGNEVNSADEDDIHCHNWLGIADSASGHLSVSANPYCSASHSGYTSFMSTHTALSLVQIT